MYKTLLASVFLALLLLSSATHAEQVAVDNAALKKWQSQADHGWWWAQAQLGELYFEGTEVKQDYSEAYFWYSLATRSDLAPIIYRANDVSKHLTREQKIAVEKRVADWVKEHQAPSSSKH